MSLCQTQVMLLTPLLKQALNEQPLLVLLWVVFVDFHNPYNHPVIRAALVARLVKNLPAMRETWVRSLGWEDPLGEQNGCPLQYSGLENSMDCIVHGVAKGQT